MLTPLPSTELAKLHADGRTERALPYAFPITARLTSRLRHSLCCLRYPHYTGIGCDGTGKRRGVGYVRMGVASSGETLSQRLG